MIRTKTGTNIPLLYPKLNRLLKKPLFCQNRPPKKPAANVESTSCTAY